MSDEKMPRCFVIMPISDQPGNPKDYFTKVYARIFKEAIEDAGYEPYRVDEDNICDSIILKIFDVGGINTIPYSSNRLYESVIEAREALSM